MRVIHEACAAPQAVSEADVTAVRARHGLARPYALFVGTIQPRKNVVRLAQAYARLAQGGVPWDLVLAGAPGWLSDPLLAELEELSLGDRLHRLGYVPDGDLPALLRGALFFVFPSLFEGFGLPVLEAQSYGVPVVTSNNSALPEVAGDAALLVDPTDVDAIADAMLRVSQDEALRAAARRGWLCECQALLLGKGGAGDARRAPAGRPGRTPAPLTMPDVVTILGVDVDCVDFAQTLTRSNAGWPNAAPPRSQSRAASSAP